MLKALLVGLDGADWSILNPLIEEGKLPNIKTICDKGISCILNSTIPPFTPQAWASIITGLNAGAHGIFGFTNKNSGKLRFSTLRDLHGKRLWQYLNEHGLSVGVVNVPLTYPPEPLNGFMVSGFMTPPQAEIFTYPAALSSFLKQKFSNYQTDIAASSNKATVSFLNELNELNEKHFKAAILLTKQFQPDVLFFVSILLDRVQHLYINYLHPQGKFFYRNNSLKQKLVELYTNLDRCLGNLIEKTSPKTIFIISDHGFVGEQGAFFVNDWLYRKGYLKLNITPSWFIKTKLASVLNHSLIKRILPPQLISKQGQKSKSVINLDQSQAFCASVPQQGIYINKDNDDYDEIKLEIINNLSSLNTESNKLKVWQKEELYSGPFMHNIPDLLLSVNDFTYEVKDIIMLSSGLKKLNSSRGIHGIKGIFAAYGTDIKTPSQDGMHIEDFLPLFLSTQGINVKQKQQINI